MAYRTEKELLSNEQYQVFMLSRLLKKDRSILHEFTSHLPFFIHESSTKDLGYDFFNVVYFQNFWPDDEIIERIKTNTKAFISSISHPEQMKIVLKTIEQYKLLGDKNRVANYFQYLKIKGDYQWVQSHKVFSSESSFLTVSNKLSELGSIGKHLRGILDTGFVDRPGWQMFQSLSKREKLVMSLLVEGYSSKQISEKLFISKLTADTYRKTIYKKLNIKTITDLVKIAQAFQLIELQ